MQLVAFANTIKKNASKIAACLQLFLLVALLASVLAASCAEGSRVGLQTAPQCTAHTLSNLPSLPSSILLHADVPRPVLFSLLTAVFLLPVVLSGRLLRNPDRHFMRQRKRLYAWIWGTHLPFRSIGGFFPPLFSRSDCMLSS